jgi:hypothetical protein
MYIHAVGFRSAEKLALLTLWLVISGSNTIFTISIIILVIVLRLILAIDSSSTSLSSLASMFHCRIWSDKWGRRDGSSVISRTLRVSETRGGNRVVNCIEPDNANYFMSSLAQIFVFGFLVSVIITSVEFNATQRLWITIENV